MKEPQERGWAFVATVVFIVCMYMCIHFGKLLFEAVEKVWDKAECLRN